MKKTDLKNLKNAYAGIFKGEMGKLIMRDLKEWCHITKTSYVPDKPDATAFNEGKRFIFLRICQMAKIDIDKIMTQSDNRKPDA